MCGITGAAAGYLSGHEIGLAETLLATSWLRGMHSTGVFAVQIDKGKTRIASHKDVLDPFTFVFNGGTKGPFHPEDKLTQIRSVVCHNRHATVGKATKRNSHPFRTQNIVGVHNGTISSYHLKFDKEYETDSEALYAEIEADGIEAVVKKLGRNVTTVAYALVYVERHEGAHKLRIIRNPERTLFYTWKAGTLFYASEKEHLAWVLGRGNTTTLNIKEFEPYKLYTLDLSQSGWGSNFTEVKDLSVNFTVVGYHGGRGSLYEGWNVGPVSKKTDEIFRGKGKTRSNGRFHYDADWDDINDCPRSLSPPLALPKPAANSKVQQVPTTLGSKTGSSRILNTETHKIVPDVGPGKVRLWTSSGWSIVTWGAVDGTDEIDPNEDVPGSPNDKLPDSFTEHNTPPFLTQSVQNDTLKKAMEQLGSDSTFVDEELWQDEYGEIWTKAQVVSAIKYGCCITSLPVTLADVTSSPTTSYFEGTHLLVGRIVNNGGILGYICPEATDHAIADMYSSKRKTQLG